MPTKASRVAVQLAADLRAEGAGALSKVTATQVQGWIDRGWLGTRTQRFPGGGGSEAVLDDEAYEAAAMIACLPKNQRTSTNVTLAKFLRGIRIDEADLRAALVATLDDLYRDGRAEDLKQLDGDELAGAAEALASEAITSRRRPPALKLWANNSRAWADSSGDPEISATPTDDLVRSALAPLIAALAGDVDAVPAAIEPLTIALGFRPVLEEVATPDRRPVDILDSISADLSVVLSGLLDAAATATLPEMAKARRVWLAMNRALGMDDVIACADGRLRRTWDTLSTSLAASCLQWVVGARAGMYDLDFLLDRFAEIGPDGSEEDRPSTDAC